MISKTLKYKGNLKIQNKKDSARRLWKNLNVNFYSTESVKKSGVSGTLLRIPLPEHVLETEIARITIRMGAISQSGDHEG